MGFCMLKQTLLMEIPVRVRFAPSPTGPLHIGGVRTALYNYLFARKYRGTMILRIEDTDRNRFVPGAEKYIIESLRWCGIQIDEGVEEGGPAGPYRQSERRDIYREHVMRLVETDWAYYAFDTPEELEDKRQEAAAAGKDIFQYGVCTRGNMCNSLTLPSEEVKRRIQSGIPFVIRFKMPENEEIRFSDIIRGEIRVLSDALDDKVLFKSDGMPTYHLANVVDDHLMHISHVIRGEEWLPSLPLHVMLYRAFGWDPPRFAHLPLLLKPTGKGKLSKRDGEKMGFPVFPLEWKGTDGSVAAGYRESGYYPGAFVNMLALLGWNPGDEKELLDMDEMVDRFSLERVGKAGARFDPEKARWFNHQYLVRKSPETLAGEFQPLLEEKGIQTDFDRLIRIVDMVKDRVDFVHELWRETWFFFLPPQEYDVKMVKKRWKAETPGILTRLGEILAKAEPFKASVLEVEVKNFLEKEHLGTGQVMNPLRLALVGTMAGPGLFDICEMLGYEEVMKRIEQACRTIST